MRLRDFAIQMYLKFEFERGFMYLWHSCLWHAEISREPWVIHYTAESSGSEKLQNKTENSRSDLKTAPSYNRANSIMMDTSSRNLIAQNWTKINQMISYIFLLIAHKYFFTNCSEINVIQNKWFIIIQTNSVLVPNLYFQLWASNFGINNKALGASKIFKIMANHQLARAFKIHLFWWTSSVSFTTYFQCIYA